jgi:hypothetical protein
MLTVDAKLLGMQYKDRCALRHIRHRLANPKTMETIQCNFPFRSRIQNPPRNVSATVEGRLAEVIKSCIKAEKKNTTWVNSDGTPLVMYLPEYVKKDIASALETELKMLAGSSKLAIPSQHRFTGVPPTQGPMDLPRGVLEFTVRQPQGHKTAIPVNSTPFHPSSTQANAVTKFFESESYVSLVRSISKMLYVLDERKWVLFRQRVDQVKSFERFWANHQHCEIQCFVSLFILVNVYSIPHFDVNDIPDGWAVMVPLGQYRGGPLYIPELHLWLPYEPRDIVFFRAAILEHFSWPFEGERYVLVFTNSKQLFKWLKEKLDSLDSTKE